MKTRFTLLFPILTFAIWLIPLADILAQPQYYNSNVNTSGGNSIPWAWNSQGVRGEQLYPAGVFGTVPAGQYISTIYMGCSSSGTGTAQYDFIEISMKQDNVTTLSGSSWTSGLTQVFSTNSMTINNTIGQWFAITLDTPFPYDPNMPLIVHIRTHMSSWYAWYCSNTTVTTGCFRNYAVGYNTGAPTGSSAYHMTFGFDLIDGQGLPYCQGFENSDGNYTAGGILNSWEHGTPNNTTISSAYEGTKAWVTDLDGDYNNDELSYVRTPKFDMTELIDPVIKFWTIRDLENGDDGVTFQVSSDTTNWTTLGSSSSTQPWYNSSSVSALTSQGNGNGWTGASSGWTPMQHSLSSYASDTSVFFRWLLAADGNTVDEGFGLDHVIIAESNDLELTELFHADSACGTSGTSIWATVCNRSVEPKSGFNIDLDTNNTTVSITINDTIDICGCDTFELTTINTSAGGYWDIFVEIDNSGDVNPANDTLSSSMLMYSTPGVELLTGDTDLCEGGIASLTFAFQGTSPWNLSFTDGTNPTYTANITSNPYTTFVSTGGIYEPLYVTDGSGCPADTSGITGQAEIVFHPAPIVDLGPDSSVCGDYVLNAGAGLDNYDWSTGATTQFITATQSGTYSVTVTDSIGCVGSDEVVLDVYLLPVVDISDTVLCEGASFTFNAGAPYAAYLWHDGSTGQLFQIDSVGTVSVTVTDFNGCEGTATASITAVVPNPTPSVTGAAGLAPVTLDAGSGYSAYLWNTNATTQTIQVSVAGTYTCTVTDQNGCEGEDDAKARVWPVSVEDIASQQGFAVHPNPARDMIYVTVDPNRGLNNYRLLGTDGKLVSEGSVPIQGNRFTLELAPGIAAGSYILEMSSDQEVLQQHVQIIQ